MTPSIVAIGINHTTAPVEIRELFSCKPTKEGVLEELSYLSNLPYVEEIVILSTCNRVEIYAVLKGEGREKELLREFINVKYGRWNPEFEKHFFIKKGLEAIEHILSVPSGLLSMVVGENQITAQFKGAFETARKQKTVGKILDRLYQYALKTAKRIRSETGISKTPLSVSYIAVLLAKKVFGTLEGLNVLVVGAGEMAELTAQYLKNEKAQIFVTNRTFSRAVELAEKVGGNIIEWENFKSFLKEVDIAVFSTGANNYLLKQTEAEKLFLKKETPTVLIDISVPRNVEPSVKNIPNLFLFNIDDLKEIAEKNLKTRKREAEKGFLIVKEEVQKFLKELEKLSIGYLLKDIKKVVDQLLEVSLKDDPERAAELFKNRMLAAIFNTVKSNPSEGRRLLTEMEKVLKNVKERVQ